jgi:hypothetical protein
VSPNQPCSIESHHSAIHRPGIVRPRLGRQIRFEIDHPGVVSTAGRCFLFPAPVTGHDEITQIALWIIDRRFREREEIFAGILLNQFQAKLHLSGTRKQPKWRLQSSLGPELASAMRDGMLQELAQHREQAEAWLRTEVSQQASQLETTIQAQEQAIFEQLQLSDATVLALKQQLARQIGLPRGILSKLPW